MAGALEALLLLVNLAAAATLAYIALQITRLARILDSPRDPAAAFTALSIGHLAAGLAPLAPDREAFTLYIASAAFTAAGLIILELVKTGKSAVMASLPLAFLPATADAAALAASLGGALAFRGAARIASTLYAIGHTTRLASLLLIPAPESAILLVAGETLRAAAAISLSIAYTPRPARGK